MCGCVSRTQRLLSPEEAIVAPSVTRQHTPSNARTRQSKTKEEKRMTPRAGSIFTHGGHRAAASAGLQRNRKSIPAVHCANTYVCWRSRREEEHREAHQHSKRHSWMAAIHAARPQPQQSRTVAAHTKRKENKTKNTAAGCGCVCVALRVSARPGRKKQNKRERNVCSAPPALVVRPHVTAPSARRSSRPLLMRAAGEAHRAVVMSVSVGVRVEQLGGEHTAPLTGRVQQETIKRVEKKKRP
ncbi:hypothetical protein ECC02_008962 [Trypanosoma cruzi]|uniref:Uncharacterized protein n=1 Tax=Trypanosoma cruzi TaxID=5693 RepID=A0A7J6XVE8_TRYCR|nr:hypothetical protein ECC02_010593 [Trypanosoma cruzi]KAF5218146.1 hypothetical protein ECC02_008962 [Trypanosoma cruzi]